MKALKPKPLKSGDRVVRNISSAAFVPWQLDDGTVDEGQRVLQLDRSRPDGVGFHAFRMAPGTTTTPHQHTCDEQFYIVDGDLEDNDGTRYGPGDLVWMRQGTEHYSRTKNGCTMIVYIESAEIAIGEDKPVTD